MAIHTYIHTYIGTCIPQKIENYANNKSNLDLSEKHHLLCFVTKEDCVMLKTGSTGSEAGS
jgi:hypothetical protein